MRAAVRLASAAMIALVAMAAPPAWADASSSLDVQSVDGRKVEMLMSFNLPEGTPPSAKATATVDIDGTSVPAQTRLVVEASPPEMVLLVLDTSRSMEGTRLTSAKGAATSFVGALPDGVDVGLISFNNAITVLAQPTTDRAKVLSGIAGLTAMGYTAIYDGVQGALAEIPEGTPARVVVLSDGQDTASEATLAEVKKSAAARGIPIDVIALRPTTAELELLREVSGASGGQLRTASTSSDLLSAFTSASQVFASQAYLTVDVPPALNASGKRATATLDVDGTVLTQTTALPLSASLKATMASAADPTTETAGVISETAVVPPEPPRQYVPLIMGLIIGFTVLVISFLAMRIRRQRTAQRRIDQVLLYRPTPLGTSRSPDAPGPEPGLLVGLDRLLARSSGYRTTRNGLAAAGVEFTPAGWLVVRIAIMAVLSIALGLLVASALGGLVLGIIFGWLTTRIWLRSRANKRRKSFGEELPDFLNLLASGLRAGLSFNSSLESCASEGKGEVGRQMRRALSEVQVGVQLDRALMDCADRMENDDLRWTVTALSIQREVGGNLSTILDSASATIKARHELGREVQTLSAEGRLSAYVLIALPVGVFTFLAIFRRDYISVFWTTTAGMYMLAGIALLIGLGWIWMRAIVRIKV